MSYAIRPASAGSSKSSQSAYSSSAKIRALGSVARCSCDRGADAARVRRRRTSSPVGLRQPRRSRRTEQPPTPARAQVERGVRALRPAPARPGRAPPGAPRRRRTRTRRCCEPRATPIAAVPDQREQAERRQRARRPSTATTTPTASKPEEERLPAKACSPPIRSRRGRARGCRERSGSSRAARGHTARQGSRATARSRARPPAAASPRREPAGGAVKLRRRRPTA